MSIKVNLRQKIEENWKKYLYIGVIAAVFITLCSRSSILYPCNNWDDANSYFSMGKFMMNGNIIYRDLYDQKGPYLYLLYGIAYLISPDSFFGVWLLEILMVGLFLFAGFKIMSLYCEEKIALLGLPILAAACLSSKSFYWGGAAEEFCLPLFGFSLYHSLRYFKEEYPAPLSLKLILVNGIFAGVVMQVKYTMLGFYFAWIAVFALMNLTRTNWKRAFSSCAVFLGGMFVTLLPWLVYFGINDALDDWYRCYIYNNIFLYSDLSGETGGLYEKVYTLAKILYYLILDNASYFIPIIIGMFFVLLQRKVRWYEKINLYALFGFLFLGIFIGGANLPYYSIPLMVFAPVGMGALGALVRKLQAGVLKIRAEIPINTESERKKRGQVIYLGTMILLMLISVAVARNGSMNTPFMAQNKEDFFLYKFKEIVQKEENPTLLNYGCLDAGLYTVAEIMPTCEYFQTNGIALKRMEEEQIKYIANGETQFILVRNSYPDFIHRNYELVGEEINVSGGIESVYYLFKRK